MDMAEMRNDDTHLHTHQVIWRTTNILSLQPTTIRLFFLTSKEEKIIYFAVCNSIGTTKYFRIAGVEKKSLT